MSTKYNRFEDVPTATLVSRLRSLSDVITDSEKSVEREFVMRIPAQLDYDADIVLCESARRLELCESKINSKKNEKTIDKIIKWLEDPMHTGCPICDPTGMLEDGIHTDFCWKEKLVETLKQMIKWRIK